MSVQLLVTDRNLNVLGDPITGWTKLACDLNFNAPASGSVQLPARQEVMELLQPGNRMLVVRDGGIWCAGPLEEPQDYVWDLDQNAGVGTVTARFTDDLARVAGYLTYPEPAKAFSAQTTTSDVVRKLRANAETIIRTLVNENCGPGALAARRIEQLVLDTVAGVGTTRTVSTRLEPLLDACRTAAAADRLGFRTFQHDGQIRFGVYAPRDLTGTARFSYGLGNVRRVGFTMGAPTATSELVMGGNDPKQQVSQGDPPNRRVYVEVASGTAADWYRVERLIEKSGTDDDSEGELTQAGLMAFGNDNPQASLSTVTVDTPDLQAGRDFGLGDKVTVVLPTNLEIDDVVQTIRLEATPDEGELVTSVIGNSDKTTLTRTVWTVRDLAYRLGQLEAKGR
ncbi:siphovirus ReqiPepy6 Gp37-like family protein [Streptomyces sp. NPDC050388]|uniref:siphovirus ReqiPepy6 Gp37-like family protein n=1 Tax=Streptomyces sp. NPDC050388 TaxID=3155781 RepID=UPI00343357CB